MWLYPAALGILGPISHHAREPRLAHSNFAAFFPAWDILFGTYEQPDDHDRPIPGVPPEDHSDDAFTGQPLWP